MRISIKILMFVLMFLNVSCNQELKKTEPISDDQS